MNTRTLPPQALRIRPASGRRSIPTSSSRASTWWRRLAVCLGAALTAHGLVAAGSRARDLNEPIAVASSESSFPYQFRDRDGQHKGFANDVMDAVARTVNLPIQRVALPGSGMAPALRSGRVDMLQFFAETADRSQWADFSVPIVRFETVAVVRKDEDRIRKVGDLARKRVAVGQVGSVGHRYLVTEQPEATPVFTETAEEHLRMLANGAIDAVVMSRVTALSVIDRLGLKNLKVLDDRVPGDDYDVRFCFAVRKGDSLLLARLNEGLAIIHRNGEFDAIYHRWFGRYAKRTFTATELLSYVAIALALACAAVSWGLIRQRTLSRRVTRQAAELAEQRSLLAALYDKHPLATVIVEIRPDGELLLISANPEAVRLFSIPPTVPLPHPLGALPLANDVRSYFDDAVNRWRATEEATHWETRLQGGQRLIEATLLPLDGNTTDGHRLCVLSADVTERRLVEHELAQSRRLRALGELVGGIAHEFNNLLTPILVTTSNARNARVLTPEVAGDFNIIDNAARRAAELTKRLLTFGRKQDEKPAPVHLQEVAENCFSLLRSTGDRRVEWNINAPPSLPALLVNPTDLNQIVFNLVINARDTLLEKLRSPHEATWTPRLGVTIEELPPEAHQHERRIVHRNRFGDASPQAAMLPLAAWQRLTVTDNGMGIPAEIMDRIFEPFFTTKEIGRGTGLGLATVWHLIGELGGDISVESTAGVGSTFRVTLPRRGVPIHPIPAPATAARETASTRSLRILLAEDDPLISRAALAILERAAHRVTHCVDGGHAWSQLQQEKIPHEVLLLDLNMPRLNGIDLIRRIRSGKFTGAIVVMSGRITEEDREILNQLNVDRIITKPFSASELIDAIRAVAATEKPAR